MPKVLAIANPLDACPIEKAIIVVVGDPVYAGLYSFDIWSRSHPNSQPSVFPLSCFCRTPEDAAEIFTLNDCLNEHRKLTPSTQIKCLIDMKNWPGHEDLVRVLTKPRISYAVTSQTKDIIMFDWADARPFILQHKGFVRRGDTLLETILFFIDDRVNAELLRSPKSYTLTTDPATAPSMEEGSLTHISTSAKASGSMPNTPSVARSEEEVPNVALKTIR